MRVLASILSFIFWLTSGPLVYAFEINQYIHAVPYNKALSRNLHTPTPNPKGILFFIHDVHAQPQAQAVVGSLVEEIQSKTKIGFVALEGYEGSIRVEAVRTYPNFKIVKAVSDYLLQNKKISGPVYAALLAKKPLPPLYGIEDSRAYRTHLESYKNAEPLTRAVKLQLNRTQKALSKDKEQFFNPALLEFHDRVAAYHQGTASLRDHLNVLTSLPLPIPEKIRSYQTALSLEKSFSMTDIEWEKKRFLASLTRRLNHDEQDDLLKASQSLKEGRLPAAEFYSRLSQLARTKNVQIEEFKNLSRYFRYSEILAGIDLEKFPDAISIFERRGFSALAKTPRERQLVSELQFVSLCNHLVDLTLTPSDWAEYKELKKANEKIAPPRLAFFEKFYEAAEVRDGTLAENILRTMENTGSQAGIVVAGGFHFQGVRSRLEQAGIAVVSVMPSFSAESLTEASPRYLKDLSTDRSILERVMAGSVWTLAPPPVDGAFMMKPAILATEGALRPGNTDGFARAAGLEMPGRNIRVSHPAPNFGRVVMEMPQGILDMTAQREGVLSDSSLKIINIQTTWSPKVGVGRALQIAWDNTVVMFRYLLGFLRPVMAVASYAWRNRSARNITQGIFLGFVVFVAGCAAPERASLDPVFTLPERFAEAPEMEGDLKDGWLAEFGDSQLVEYVKEVIKNPELRSQDNRKVAAAQYDTAHAGLFPSVGFNGGISATDSLNGNTSIGKSLGGRIAADWEVFGFGRLTNIQDAAEWRNEVARWQNEANTQQYVGVFAKTYFLLTVAQQRIVLAERQLKQAQEILRLAEVKKRVGRVEPKDIASANSAISLARQRLTRLQSDREVVARAVTRMLGRAPSKDFTAPTVLPEVKPMAVGVPVKVLERRPVMRVALAAYEAQFATTMAAHHARWPVLSLTAGVSESKILSNSSGINFPASIGWDVVAGVAGPLLDFGRREGVQRAANEQANLMAEVAKDVAAHVLEEVENDLGIAKSLDQQILMMKQAVADKEEVVRIGQIEYEAGKTDAQDFVRQTIELQGLQQELAGLQFERIAIQVNLNIAAGGKFEKPAEPDNATVKTGGSWITHPFYVAHLAWLETPLVFLAVFLSQVAIAASASIVPADLPRIFAVMWLLAPVSFYALHAIGNAEALLDPAVGRLTVGKVGIAVLGIFASLGGLSPTVSALVMLPFVGLLSVIHRRLQAQVVAENQSEKSTRFDFSSVGSAVRTGVVLRNQVDVLRAIQSSAIEQFPNGTAALPGTIRKNVLNIAVLDAGFKGDRAAYVKKVLGGEAKQGQKVLFVCDTVEMEENIRALVGNRISVDVSVISDPTLFEEGALSLKKTEGLVDERGFLDSAPSVTLMARADLALIQNGSAFRNAVIILLTETLAAVPFRIQDLENWDRVAKAIQRQA